MHFFSPEKNPRFPGLAWLALSLLACLQGCVPPVLVVRTPQQVALVHDLTLSPGELAAYRDTLQQQPKGKQAAMACYFLGQGALRAKNWAQAEKYFKRCQKEFPNSGWDANAGFMLAASQERQGLIFEALERFGYIAQAKPGFENLPQQANDSCLRLLGGLDAAGLEKAFGLGAALPEEAQALVHFKRLEALSSSGQVDALLPAMEVFYQKFPSSALRPKVDDLAKQAFRKIPVEPRTLGLLTPLHGQVAQDAQEVVNGAQLALEEANQNLPEDRRFKLVIEDEGSGNTTTAGQAARKLIEQDKVLGILGPMFSINAQAVAPLCASRRVPFITSAALKPGLTDLSPFLFRNAMTYEKQAATMADYALLDRRVTRVAALYPDNAYGNSLCRAFARRFGELGGSVLAQVSFTPGARDFKAAMLELGGVDPGQAKDAEVEARKELQQKVERVSSSFGETLLRFADLSRTAQATPTPGEEKSFPRKVPRLPTPTPVALIKLVVLDFACDTPSAAMNTGPVLSDKFRRTLSQLRAQGLEVISSGPTASAMKARGLKPEDLNPTTASDIARSLGAGFVLGGSVAEEAADFDDLKLKAQKKGEEGRRAQRQMDLFTKNQVFEINAQLIDAATTSLAAYQRFDYAKLKPVTSNARSMQGLYLPCNFEDALLIAPTMLSFDLKVPMFGADSWHRAGLLRDTEYLEGACFSTGFFPESASPLVQGFVKDYQKRYASPPGVLAAQAFDACRIILRLASGGASNREDLKEGLESLRDFEGVTGLTSFAGNRDAVKKLPILEVRNGEFIQIK